MNSKFLPKDHEHKILIYKPSSDKDVMRVRTAFIEQADKLGDIITFPIKLSKWERFLKWCRHPFSKVAREEIRQFVVTSVSDHNSFAIKK